MAVWSAVTGHRFGGFGDRLPEPGGIERLDEMFGANLSRLTVRHAAKAGFGR